MANHWRIGIAKWRGKTDHLTLEQEAAVLRIAMAEALTGKPVRDDPGQLSKLWRTTTKRAKRLRKELIEAGILHAESASQTELHLTYNSLITVLYRECAARKALKKKESGEKFESQNVTPLLRTRAPNRASPRAEHPDYITTFPLPSGGREGAPAKDGDGGGLDLEFELHKIARLDTGGIIPSKWASPEASMEIGRWVGELGLTGEEVLKVARKQMAHYGQAPWSPKAWSKAMEAEAHRTSQARKTRKSFIQRELAALRDGGA